MTIYSENIGDVLVLSPEGRIDSGNSENFKNNVSNYINDEQSSIVLDFDKIEYISSACLRSLLSISKQMSLNNKKLALCNLNESVEKIIRVSGFDSILDIYESREHALEEINK